MHLFLFATNNQRLCIYHRRWRHLTSPMLRHITWLISLDSYHRTHIIWVICTRTSFEPSSPKMPKTRTAKGQRPILLGSFPISKDFLNIFKFLLKCSRHEFHKNDFRSTFVAYLLCTKHKINYSQIELPLSLPWFSRVSLATHLPMVHGYLTHDTFEILNLFSCDKS